MPTVEYAEVLYPKFGVKAYHDANHFGRNVSIYIIDTGLTNTSESLGSVKNRTVVNSMGSRKTHGSFVASIIAFQRHNGLSGIAPDAQVYLSDVSNSEGTIYTSALIKAIKDATELCVDIISISLGTNVYDQRLEDSIKAAVQKGILVFAASGNCSCRAYEFPSACDDAISVASMDIHRRPSPFNTRNDSVALFAPGQNIMVPGSKSRLSGTSFAVPFASGLAALELSKRRSTNPKATLERQEAITIMRAALGLSCEEHTYANDVCAGLKGGGSFKPPESDGLSWFVILAACSGAIFWYTAQYARMLQVGIK
jgi:subtilisin family serine protease